MPQEYYLDLIKARASALERPFSEGIDVTNGVTKPFLVERVWSGPAGNYQEQWSIRSGKRNVVYSHPGQLIFVRGMQSATTLIDEVSIPVRLTPGSYQLVFVVEGRFMGSVDVEVAEAGSAAA